jgi:hypothetical protein
MVMSGGGVVVIDALSSASSSLAAGWLQCAVLRWLVVVRVLAGAEVLAGR